MPDSNVAQANRFIAAQDYFRSLQRQICAELEKIDGKATFGHDPWQHRDGGGGVSCVMEGGAVFEKAGVNFSSIHGSSLPASATESRLSVAPTAFRATGLSLVCHPLNPYAPTTHMNVRCIDATGQCRWFGGGFDLTPYYGFKEDALHWHQTASDACQGFEAQLYQRLKKACDEYFYLKHRDEARGIGGLFFDDFEDDAQGVRFRFVKSVGDHFLKAYLPIIKRRMDVPYGERERSFQLYRRGRYVEFNLVYDRGTLFGLQSAGRTESILMSLPPMVSWRYDWKPQPGSPESALHEDFLRPRDWLSMQ